MATTLTNLLFHIVFSTKDRCPTLKEELTSELHQSIGSIIKHERGVLLEAGGTADHIHLLARFRADVSVSDMLRRIKASSSRWLAARDPHWGGWQRTYGAFSVSESQVERTRRYLQRQREHHRFSTFREELVRVLERHGIEYDERYL